MTMEYPYGDGVVKWVSTEWLENNLDDDNLMRLDVQPNVHDYIEEHIPGAVYMNPAMLRVPKEGRPAVFVPQEVAQGIFRRVGLSPDVPVVVYTGTGAFKGWGDGLEQTFVAYTLARFGHNNVFVLDGGLDKWKNENRPLTKEFPDITTSDFEAEVRREYFVDYDEFKEIKDQDDVILLDARPPSVYEGQGPWIKAGHIPGAVNVPWVKFMDDDNTRLLLPMDEIEEVLEKHNITRDKTIICSCGTGREASNEFLLFKWYLGFPSVKLHEGAFTEWSSYPDNPTVLGPNPR